VQCGRNACGPHSRRGWGPAAAAWRRPSPRSRSSMWRGVAAVQTKASGPAGARQHGQPLMRAACAVACRLWGGVEGACACGVDALVCARMLVMSRMGNALSGRRHARRRSAPSLHAPFFEQHNTSRVLLRQPVPVVGRGPLQVGPQGAVVFQGLPAPRQRCH